DEGPARVATIPLYELRKGSVVLPEAQDDVLQRWKVDLSGHRLVQRTPLLNITRAGEQAPSGAALPLGGKTQVKEFTIGLPGYWPLHPGRAGVPGVRSGESMEQSVKAAAR